MVSKASVACARAFVATAIFSSAAAAVFILPAAAEPSLATILAPADGAKLEAKHAYKVEYEVQPSAKIDHVHLFVDGDEAAMVYKLKGGIKFGPLKAGNHKVCVSPVNKNHTPVGAQACITVTVQ